LSLISVVVPVYGSANSVDELAARLERVFGALDDDYELILVDDHSPTPETWPTLERLATGDPRVRALQLTRNFGQQAATLCGLSEARGDWVVTMDDDLQHQPEDIPALLGERHHDIVIAQFERKHHSLFKRATSRLKGWFDRVVLDKPRGVQLSPFRLLSRTVVDGMLRISTPNPYLPALMLHVSRDLVGVPAVHRPRGEGRSGYGLSQLVTLFSRLIIDNSSLLLRLVGHLGVLFALVSFLLAGTIAVRRLLHGTPVAGWTSLIATMLLLGGLLLFGLGIVGEYLIRIIEASEAKPTYFVRRRTGSADSPVAVVPSRPAEQEERSAQ
jgi:dolichol-phosphate mannosyltransferase/undecaprenyl-phosphate 4-deoxy-4-formamido-L-arabinose transferase